MHSEDKTLNLTKAELLEQLELEIEQDYRACEKSLYRFFLSAWSVLEPNTPLYTNWHLEYVCEQLEQVTQGKTRRLIINVPPRSLKSTIATICWPVWEWISRPWERFMFASYSQALSTEHSMARRRLVESDWFRRRWGHLFSLEDDQNAKHYFKNDRTGHMYATSLGGSATGFGGNKILVDDPHNTKKAESDVERQQALEDFDKGLTSRPNDPKTGAIVVIMQRLHQEDLTGHLLKKNIPGLVHVCLPTIAARNEDLIFPISGRIISRRTGDLLHSERLGPAEVAQAKLDLGSFGFAGQHQQEPAPLEGGLLKVANWRRYTPADLPKRFDRVVLSWDMRFKKTTSELAKNKGDYVAGVVLAQKGARIYLLDVIRGLWGFKDSRSALQWLAARNPDAISKYVENKANGPGIVDDLEETIVGLTLVEPKGDKMQRVQLTVPYQEAGNLWLPADGHTFSDSGIGGAKPLTAGDFIKECAVFPNGSNDDMLDAFTQGVLEIMQSGWQYLRDMAGVERERPEDDGRQAA
jgi:predicted phage terminase large subunit-like protein